MGTKPTDPPFYSTLYQDQQDKFIKPEGYPNNLTLPKNVITREEQPGYYRFSDKSLTMSLLKTSRAVYGIDQFVGNMRTLLDELNLSENTIIVFFSDNGLLYGEHGLGGKTLLYEESVRVPLIVYSPFLAMEKRDKKRAELVVGQDIPATLLDMCRLSVPKTYQGKSMLPLIEAGEGIKVAWRKDIFLENLFTDQGYPRHDAVRGERFKYIRYYSKENDRNKYLPNGVKYEQPIYEELFDIKADPKELNNLAENPKFVKILNDHRNRCGELATKLAK